jgi:membrane protease YdiL (CAAX protease family)
MVIAFWIIFQMLSLLSGMLIFSYDFSEILVAFENLDEAQNLALLKYIQAGTSIGMFILASLVSAYFISDNPVSFLKLDRIPGWFIIVIVCILIVITLPMNNYLTYLNGKLQVPEGIYWLQEYFERKEGEMENIMVKFLKVSGPVPLLINIFVIALIPAIGEELLFRGIVQPLASKGFRSIHAGVILTAFLFGILHFQFLSFLPRFVLGILLGYIYLYTASLWMPILAHFVNNGLAVVFYYMYYSGQTGDQLEDMGTPGHAPFYTFISIILVVMLLYFLRKSYYTNQNLPAPDQEDLMN